MGFKIIHFKNFKCLQKKVTFSKEIIQKNIQDFKNMKKSKIFKFLKSLKLEDVQSIPTLFNF